MATLPHRSRRPGGPRVGSRIGTGPTIDDLDVTARERGQPVAAPVAPALPDGRDALVPVMEHGDEPGKRRSKATIHVSETDARWWFG